MAKKKTGRKKKPLALRLIDGGAGHRPINEKEPKAEKVFDPKPPADYDKLHKAKWKQMCKQLSDSRVLTVLDLDALDIYVRNWILLCEARLDLKDRGKLLRTATGAPMWNPSWSQCKYSEGICRSMMAEFGMTPSSRTGIIADAGDDGKTVW